MTESMCQSEVVHGFAVYRDRELSDNLLQTEDDLDQLHASRAKDADAFCGWIPDPRAPQRRPKDNPANKPPPKRLRSTKERRLSQQNLRANYEFRHYRDIGRYIQQYRREHSCTVAPRDTNPDFTSDALVALLRKADPQKPYLIPRTRVQDIPGCSLEPPKLGVLRRAVTGTSRDWHSFSGSSVSRPVTEEALTTSHSPPQLSQQIPARGPERVVAGCGDASPAGCSLHFTSQSRPSTATTESRDSGSSSNSNSKPLPNPGTLTLAFSINGNSNRQQQQRPPSTAANSNRAARPQYTSIVRSDPSSSVDSKQADGTSVSDMSATGINIMAMDRQDFLEHLENFTWREKLKLLSLQEQRPLGAWFRQRGQHQAKPPDAVREKTPEKNKRRAERNSQRFKCLALDPDNAVMDHWEGDRHQKERHAQLNQKSLGVVLFKKSLLPERDVRKRLLFNAKGGGWKTYAASNLKPNPVEGYQIPDDISAVTQIGADVRDSKRLTEMVSIKTRKDQLKSPGKTTPL